MNFRIILYGKDKIAKIATIRIVDGTIKRPIIKVYILSPDEAAPL